MKVDRALTWVSRTLFGLGWLVFAGNLVFMLVETRLTSVDAHGQASQHVFTGEEGVFALMFSSIGWCWLAGDAAQTLATSPNWKRALLRIGSLVGFGLVVSTPAVLLYGSSGEPGASRIVAATVCAVAGFLVIGSTQVAAFVSFGAKDALHAAEHVVGRVKGSGAAARAEEYVGPFVPLPGYEVPTAALPPPEHTAPDLSAQSTQA